MNEIQAKFDYAKVGSDVAEELRKHEVAIRAVQAKAIYEIGSKLQAAHELLAKNRYGNFYSWCSTYLGLSSTTVDNFIHGYKLIAQNLGKRDMLEELPKSLLYAAGAESAPPELTQKVLDGEITTHKQWQKEKKALEAEKKQLESDKRQAEARAEQAEQELQDLRDNPTVVETPADPRLEAELAEEKQKRSEEKQKRIEAEQQIAWLKQNPPEPKDYRETKRRNEDLQKENAMYRAHEEGFTLNEKAQVDEKYAKYKNTVSDEIEKSKRIINLIGAVRELPKSLEIADYVECYIRQHSGAEALTRAEVEKMMIDLQVIHDELDRYINKSGRLQVVK